MKPIVIAMVVVTGCFTCHTYATNRYFPDVIAESPSGRYCVEARSPDNADGGRGGPFQCDFVYTLKDVKTGVILWTRNQNDKVEKVSTEGKVISIHEGSPSVIRVSDEGWTVIGVDFDKLIIVGIGGQDRCVIDLREEWFKRLLGGESPADSTGSSLWSRQSLWYFLTMNGRQLFVIRPWFERRIVVDIATASIIEDEKLLPHAKRWERKYVLAELEKGVSTRDEWEEGENWDAVEPVTNAAFLAGQLKMKEAVVYLRNLQDCRFSGGLILGGSCAGKNTEESLSFRSYPVRQVVHTSLRRLGESPGKFPVNTLISEEVDSDEEVLYRTKPLFVSRAENIEKVAVGMRPKKVLDLLGGPDVLLSQAWEYDIDANKPYTLVIHWEEMNVKKIGILLPEWRGRSLRDYVVGL